MTELIHLLASSPFTGGQEYVYPNEAVHWQGAVWAYLALTGFGSGSLIISILPRLPWAMDAPSLARLRRIALITALACFLVIPLGVLANEFQPARMWRVVVFPNVQSVMPWGAYALAALILLTVFHLWHMHRPEMAWAASVRSDLLGKVYGFLAFGYDLDDPPKELSERTERALHTARIVAEISFVAYSGFLLSTLVLVPYGIWSTPLLGPLFFFMAMASGYAWLLFVGITTGFLREHPRMMRLLAGSGATFFAGYLMLRLWELGFSAYIDDNVWPAVAEITFGVYGWSFFGIEVLLGGLVVVALLAVAAWTPDEGKAFQFAVVASVLGMLGMLVARWHLVIGGQQMSRTLEGVVPADIGFWGEQGWLAAIALLVFTLTAAGAMLWFLPYRGAKHNTSAVDESKPPEELAKAKRDDRRRFLTVLGGLGVGAAGGYATVRNLVAPRYEPREPGPGPSEDEAVVINSICLSCDARCGTRAVVRDGQARTLFGNPFHPANTMNQPLPYESTLEESLRASGSLCMKGVSGLQYLYDPYRVRLPLKRSGERGSGEFETISWQQLIDEVVEGGRLFADAGDDREVEGLRALSATDPIDPDAPELGPSANGLVWNTGRGQTPRTSFIQRFLGSIGSTNYVSHTDLCQMNWYTANYLFTGRYNYDPEPGSVNQLFGDIVNGELMLMFGVSLGAGWKPGVNTSAPILANRHADGDGKVVLIDPYAQHARHYVDEWVPIKPATDAAMLLAMMQWILANEREDAAYLENCSAEAAEADGEPSWTNSAFLVVVEEGHEHQHRFLRAGDVGIDRMVPYGEGDDEVMVDAYLVVDPDTGEVTPNVDVDAGELYVDTTVDLDDGSSVAVKSSLQLLREEAESRSIEEWAEICEVPAEQITGLAEEFVSHGRKATASCYRGATMHAQGVYAGLAVNMLNALIGNLNRKGGVVRNQGGPGWDSGLYDLATVEDAPGPSGAHISRISGRSDVFYEQTAEADAKAEANGGDPYPSERPWYPFTHAGITTEALAGADQAYPYPVKVWINYYVNQRNSVPGGKRFEETFADPDKIPLFISVDTTINESSVYADYIVPDVMFLDGQYGFMGQQTAACTAPGSAIRQPVVEPLTGRTDDGRAMMLETFLIDCAKELGLPGFGPDAIPGDPEGPHAGQAFPLEKAEDYYVRAIGNFAHNAATPEAPDEEITYAERFPVASHREVLTDEEWRQAAYVLVRGGYFEAPEAAWDDEERHTIGVEVDPLYGLQMWHEVFGSTAESTTGRLRYGTATYREPDDGMGRSLAEADAEEFPFTVTTFRESTRTKARTAYDYWAHETHPRNHVQINPDDAADLGIADGDVVRISSRSGSVDGAARLTSRVRRGSIAGTHHYGHRQQGVSDWRIAGAEDAILGARVASDVLHGDHPQIVDGDLVKGDPRRSSAGFMVNDAMRRNDDVLADTPLVDNVGGGTVFLDTRVKVERVDTA